MFEQTLMTGTEGPVVPAKRECRVYERHSCELAANCQPPTLWGGKDLKWGAQIRDISVGGVSLVLRRRFERGAGLAIELPGSPDGLPNTVLARVVHVRPQEGGVWVLGCSFVSPLSEEEVATLLPRPSA